MEKNLENAHAFGGKYSFGLDGLSLWRAKLVD